MIPVLFKISLQYHFLNKVYPETIAPFSPATSLISVLFFHGILHPLVYFRLCSVYCLLPVSPNWNVKLHVVRMWGNVVIVHWCIKSLEQFLAHYTKKERKWSRSVVSNSCDSMNCSLPGFSVHGISQARILEWVAIFFSRGSSQSRDWTWVSHTAGRLFTVWATMEATLYKLNKYLLLN